MKKIELIVILLLFETCLLAQNPVVKSVNEFGTDLYKLLPANENLFISPLSLNIALGMVYAGAKGQTEEAMQETMHIDNKMAYMDAYPNYLSDLQSMQELTLRWTNALWAQKKYDIALRFVAFAQDNFDASCQYVDFRTNKKCEKTRKQINSWVEKNTEDKIKNLIKPNFLEKDTRLILTNAVYFKATWENSFKESATKPDLFYSTKSENEKAEFMHKTQRMRYLRTDSYQAIELPYRENEAAMYIFLPKFIDGLADFEKDFSADILHDFELNSSFKSVELSLPKFRIEYETELSDILKETPMEIAFGKDADFRGINPDNELKISKVIHKTYINLNEKGTEAAAATAVVMMRKTSIGSFHPVVFKANHPFFFIIADRKNKSILFMGRLREI